MRVLLVWLFLIRLTSVVATPPDHPDAKTVTKKKTEKAAKKKPAKKPKKNAGRRRTSS